ncbi:hypothetical protein F5Y11DRAFT_319188, partial [Daldinia sp. FL1419]
MPARSDNAAYNGTTPPKPTHFFSSNPPTNDATDSQSLKEYRLAKFKDETNSVLFQNVQSNNAQAKSIKNLAVEVETILTSL